MFIGPPKLVFIKTTEGSTQAAIRTATTLGTKGQTILVAPAPVTTQASQQAVATVSSAANMATVATTTISDDTEDTPPPRYYYYIHTQIL